MKSIVRSLAAFLLTVVVAGGLHVQPVEAALIDRVNEAFRTVYGRTPTAGEWSYWAGRVTRGEKTTFEALAGAMGYQKAQEGTTGVTVAPSAARVATWQTEKIYYPSAHGPNVLPEGTLITAPGEARVFLVENGRKSWVLESVLNKWLNENHFFKRSIIVTIPAADLAAYPTGKSVNKVYIGKVLQHPNGTQFYIDDHLRKRQISAAVRGALRFPGGNAYPTSAAHLSEFATGPAITSTSAHPGGMAIYDGPYHGGRIWKTEEGAGGVIFKRLYLKDRFYEADGYPDESQRAPVDATVLARHPRGANIDRYPDGWVIAIGSDIYVMDGGKRRLITSPALFDAMGYTEAHVRREYPDLYRKLPQGEPIRAFKSIVANGVSPSKGAAAPAPSTASYPKVRPHLRALIADMNNIYRLVFDKEVTISENQFWVDYVYSGEVNSRSELIAAMQRTKLTGTKPAKTSRTAVLGESTLEQKWYPYLFYFVHQKDPNEDDNDYWYDRIRPGDRDTIEKLGGTLQWIKENFNGATRR